MELVCFYSQKRCSGSFETFSLLFYLECHLNKFFSVIISNVMLLATLLHQSVGKHINKSLSVLKKPVFVGKIRIIQMSKGVNMKKKKSLILFQIRCNVSVIGAVRTGDHCSSGSFTGY